MTGLRPNENIENVTRRNRAMDITRNEKYQSQITTLENRNVQLSFQNRQLDALVRRLQRESVSREAQIRKIQQCPNCRLATSSTPASRCTTPLPVSDLRIDGTSVHLHNRRPAASHYNNNESSNNNNNNEQQVNQNKLKTANQKIAELEAEVKMKDGELDRLKDKLKTNTAAVAAAQSQSSRQPQSPTTPIPPPATTVSAGLIIEKDRKILDLQEKVNELTKLLKNPAASRKNVDGFEIPFDYQQVRRKIDGVEQEICLLRLERDRLLQENRSLRLQADSKETNLLRAENQLKNEINLRKQLQSRLEQREAGDDRGMKSGGSNYRNQQAAAAAAATPRGILKRAQSDDQLNNHNNNQIRMGCGSSGQRSRSRSMQRNRNNDLIASASDGNQRNRSQSPTNAGSRTNPYCPLCRQLKRKLEIAQSRERSNARAAALAKKGQFGTFCRADRFRFSGGGDPIGGGGKNNNNNRRGSSPSPEDRRRRSSASGGNVCGADDLPDDIYYCSPPSGREDGGGGGNKTGTKDDVLLGELMMENRRMKQKISQLQSDLNLEKAQRQSLDGLYTKLEEDAQELRRDLMREKQKSPGNNLLINNGGLIRGTHARNSYDNGGNNDHPQNSRGAHQQQQEDHNNNLYKELYTKVKDENERLRKKVKELTETCGSERTRYDANSNLLETQKNQLERDKKDLMDKIELMERNKRDLSAQLAAHHSARDEAIKLKQELVNTKKLLESAIRDRDIAQTQLVSLRSSKQGAADGTTGRSSSNSRTSSSQLERELSAREKELKEKDTVIKTLDSEYSSIRERLRSQEIQLTRLTMQVDEGQRARESLTIVNATLSSELDKAKKETQQAFDELSQSIGEQERLRRLLDDHIAEVKTLQSLLSEKEEERKELIKQLRELNNNGNGSTLHTLSGGDGSSRFRSLVDDTDGGGEGRGGEEGEFSSKDYIRVASLEMDRLRNENNRLKEERETLEEQIARCQSSLEALQETSRGFRSEKDSLMRDLSQLRTVIQALDAEKSSLKIDTATKDTELSSLNAEVIRLRGELGILENREQRESAAVSQLEAALDNYREQQRSTTSDLAEKNSQIDQLSAAMAESHTKLELQRREIHSLRGKLDAANGQLDKYRNRNRSSGQQAAGSSTTSS